MHLGSKHHQAGHLIFSDVQKNKKVTYFDIRPKNVRIASCQFRIRKFLYEVPWVFSNGCIEVLHPFKNSAAERVASLWATLSFSMGGLDRDSRGLLAERERERRGLQLTLTWHSVVVTCCSNPELTTYRPSHLVNLRRT